MNVLERNIARARQGLGPYIPARQLQVKVSFAFKAQAESGDISKLLVAQGRAAGLRMDRVTVRGPIMCEDRASYVYILKEREEDEKDSYFNP